MKSALKSELKIKANYKFYSLSDDIKENGIEIKMLREHARHDNKAMLNLLKEGGVLLDFDEKHNLVVTAGRSAIARRLAGDTTYSLEVDWGALGNGVSPSFNNASTQLSAEVVRKQASDQSYDGHITYIDWLILSGDVANQTFTEFGSFIDGSASANSGQAFSLLATGGWVKSGAMFISAKYTIT